MLPTPGGDLFDIEGRRPFVRAGQRRKRLQLPFLRRPQLRERFARQQFVAKPVWVQRPLGDIAKAAELDRRAAGALEFDEVDGGLTERLLAEAVAVDRLFEVDDPDPRQRRGGLDDPIQTRREHFAHERHLRPAQPDQVVTEAGAERVRDR